MKNLFIISLMILLAFVSCKKQKDIIAAPVEGAVKEDRSSDQYSGKGQDLKELRGRVNIIVTYKGAPGETSYFVIRTDSGEQKILFNKGKRSYGFDKYVGKKIKVRGFDSPGLAGARNIMFWGFQVMEIEALE